MSRSIYTINLKNEIAPTIGSREAVLLLKKRIQEISHPDQVILDFTGIEFISRAVAHEFLLLEDTLKAQNIKVHFEHLAEDVAKMFEMVRKSRLIPNTQKTLSFTRMDAAQFFAMN